MKMKKKQEDQHSEPILTNLDQAWRQSWRSPGHHRLASWDQGQHHLKNFNILSRGRGPVDQLQFLLLETGLMAPYVLLLQVIAAIQLEKIW